VEPLHGQTRREDTGAADRRHLFGNAEKDIAIGHLLQEPGRGQTGPVLAEQLVQTGGTPNGNTFQLVS
jgi:hypothetical protein